MASERSEKVGEIDVAWREGPVQGGTPVLYVHGVPTDGDDFLPFLERTGGVALDLPGFGRSGKPPHFDYSIAGYTAFLREFTAQRGLERFSLVVHDWGALALALAQEEPERIERLVLIDAVPLLSGYTWHRVARLWRTPLVGELAMGLTFKRYFAREVPAQLVDSAWQRFDHGTQRAILKLYRSGSPATLEAAGARLDTIKAPALVVWGERDPYIPAVFAQRNAERLGGETRVEIAAGAGHWAWLDAPELVETVASFTAAT